MGFTQLFNSSRRLICTVLAAASLLTVNAYAQDTLDDQVFLYDDFSGGLNTKLSKFSLPKQQGDIYENIRFDERLRALTKRDKTVIACDTLSSDPITGIHRFYKKDGTKKTIINYSNKIAICDESTGLATTILTTSSSDQRWQWETWHDLAIGTDGNSPPVKYDGTSTSATYLGTLLAKDAGSGAGPNGTYQYKVTCYTANYEVSLDTASPTVSVSDNDLNLSMIPICTDQFLGQAVIGRKIYRTENAGSTYKILTNGVIADNISVTLTDSDSDAQLGATINPTDIMAPPTGRLIVIHKNRMWLANNADSPSRLFYSEDGEHDFFLSDAYLDIRPNDGDGITFIKNLLGLLTVSKNKTIQKIDTSGDDPVTDWAISDPFSFIGCQAMYSAVNTDAGIMYLGNNGVYVFSGQYSELISDDITPEIRNISLSNFNNVWATYYKNTYYMAYTARSTGSSFNDRILLVDLITKSFSIDLLNISVLHVFGSGSDVEALYSGASNDGIIYAHTDTLKEIIHKTHANFTGTWDDMRYIPEGLAEGDADDPVLELAWTTTVDGTLDAGWTGNVNSLTTSIIDRPDTAGSYTSQVLTVNANRLDKVYWNEVMPPAGGDVTFDIRVGGTLGEIQAAAWTTGFTNSSGSDISAVAGDVLVQYRINMSTNTITQTPNLVLDQNYVVRLTYGTSGLSNEVTIPLHYRSGWLDYGAPGFVKELRKIYVYYDWPDNTAGTLTLTFRSINGEIDTFNINLLDNPDYYVDYFPDGNMVGELIELEITESSLNPIKIEKIIVVYGVQKLT